jgi:hypothetical protein
MVAGVVIGFIIERALSHGPEEGALRLSQRVVQVVRFECGA